jgi:hypothetical protein
VKSSDKLPNRGVLRTRRIGCAQFGQRSGLGAGLFAPSPDVCIVVAIDRAIFITVNRNYRESLGHRRKAIRQADDIEAASLLRSGQSINLKQSMRQNTMPRIISAN